MQLSIKTLEFDKILERISKNATSLRVKENILNQTTTTDVNEINKMLLEKNEALNLIYKSGNITLNSDYDIDILLKNISKGMIVNPNDLLKILSFLKTVQINLRYYKESQNIIEIEYLNKYFSKLTDPFELLNKIRNIVDENGYILDTASINLSRIRKQILKYKQKIKDTFESLKSKYKDFLNEEVLVLKDDSYCLVVNQSFKKRVRGSVISISQSGQSYYIEPEEILEIKSNISILEQEEKKEINKILIDFTKVLQFNLGMLENSLYCLVNLDYIFSCSLYFKSIECNLQKVSFDKTTILKSARHPLIDLDKVVPIDFYTTNEKPITVITGPNTGGKTASMKTLGLLTIMTMAGFLIPASSDSQISVYENIYADIGDEQSIEQSLSTFSSHLKKIIGFLENAKSNDLILIDELGSGTDPIEGEALAICILQKFIEIGTTLLVTTHYPKLKLLAYEIDKINLASMKFNKDTLSPEYKLIFGVSGDSNAILISKKLGLINEIIEKANDLVKGKKDVNLGLIDKLNKEHQKVINLKEELEKKEIELTLKIREYEKLISSKEKELDTKISLIEEKEKEKYNKKYNELNQVLDNLLKKDLIPFNELSELKSKFKETEKTQTIDYDFKVGDSVYIPDYEKNGIIKEIKKDKYLIDLGPFELSFTKDKLRLETKKVVLKKENNNFKAKESNRYNILKNKEVKTEIDLRGVRYIEVDELLEKEIDNLLLSGINQLKIIHGYGTGAIKKAVDEFIQKHKNLIKSKRSGGEKEGLMGVTIITF